MSLTSNPAIASILDAILAELGSGQPLYLVGGSVRGLLLGRPFNDLDFVMPDDPTSLAKAVARRLKAGFFVLDDVRRTTRIVHTDAMGKMFPLDFVKFTGNTLVEDLQSRDFTVNAMAISMHDLATIIDPLKGREDLKQGRLSLCNPESLIADPVRVLRGIRLAIQFGFDFGPGLERKFQEAAVSLPNTSYERQRDEFFKILEGNDPAQGIVYCRQFNVFETLIPGLVQQEGIPASDPHVYPLIEHTWRVVKYLDQLLKAIQSDKSSEVEQTWWLLAAKKAFAPYSDQMEKFFQEELTPGRNKSSLALFGALLHDLGKPMTMKVGEDGRLHYYNHAQVGADLALEVAKRLKLSKAECNWVTDLVRHHMDLLPLINGRTALTPRVIYRFYQKVDEVGVAILLHTLADTIGTYGETLSREKWEQAVTIAAQFLSAWWDHKESLVNPTPLLDGNDIQRLFGLNPGKKIGELLDALLEAQAGGEIKTQEEAEAFIMKQIK